MNIGLTLSLSLLSCLLPVSAVLAQLQSNGTQFWHQASPGIGVAPEADAAFGGALTVALGDSRTEKRR